MPAKVDDYKMLTVVGAVLFTLLAWMGNKIVTGQNEMDNLVTSARQTIAVMEYRISELEKDCGRKP